MTNFKRTKIVMLPSVNTQVSMKGDIYLSEIQETSFPLGMCLEEPNSPTSYNKKNIKQHLYFLSDEPIKEGDYMFNPMDNNIIKWDGDLSMTKNPVEYNYKRVIASTDKELGLPQPSKEFIDVFISEYNKGSIIESVMVEYETVRQSLSEIPKKTSNGTEYIEMEYELQTILKTDKSNTISIRKVKDSWNRKEVISLLRIAFNAELEEDGRFEKWIENNL